MEYDFEKEVSDFENTGSVVKTQERIITTFENKMKTPPVSGYTDNVRVEDGRVFLKLKEEK